MSGDCPPYGEERSARNCLYTIFRLTPNRPETLHHKKRRFSSAAGNANVAPAKS
jgi:hypothetical protein